MPAHASLFSTVTRPKHQDEPLRLIRSITYTVRDHVQIDRPRYRLQSYEWSDGSTEWTCWSADAQEWLDLEPPFPNAPTAEAVLTYYGQHEPGKSCRLDLSCTTTTTTYH